MNYPTAALFFWKQMVLTHGQRCVICWQWLYLKCYFASPSDFGITDHCWTWASILHGSLVHVGKQFWCSSTAFDEYLTQLDLWLLPALKKYPSSLFCFISSNSSNMMLQIWLQPEQGPQENRAWRNLGMLSGPPSSSKTEPSLPDKTLANISRQKIIWGQLYPIRLSDLVWICVTHVYFVSTAEAFMCHCSLVQTRSWSELLNPSLRSTVLVWAVVLWVRRVEALCKCCLMPSAAGCWFGDQRDTALPPPPSS